MKKILLAAALALSTVSMAEDTQPAPAATETHKRISKKVKKVEKVEEKKTDAATTGETGTGASEATTTKTETQTKTEATK